MHSMILVLTINYHVFLRCFLTNATEIAMVSYVFHVFWQESSSSLSLGLVAPAMSVSSLFSQVEKGGILNTSAAGGFKPLEKY